MNSLLVYTVKAALCITLLYMIYALLLSRDTMYLRNRIYILFSLLLAFILPLIEIRTPEPHDIQFFGQALTGITISDMAVSDSSASGIFNLSLQKIILIIYLAGVIITGIKFLAEVTTLLALIIRQKKHNNNVISLTSVRTSGFSAFGHIFIDRDLNPDEAGEIIRHEKKHLAGFHFYDILLSEALKVFQWFNPFIYFFDRSLRAVHEYQADEECLNSGIPVHSYQGLVMNQVFRSRIFSAANSFSNPTLIKKRMIMMTKKRSNALANLKILMVVPGLALLLVVFSTCSEKIAYTDTVVEAVAAPSNAPITKGGEPEPFVVVEKMPLFPGGDSALLRYIAENTKYPEAARANKIQGRVIVRFCITETGNVDRISVIKGVDPELDKESMRVVSTLPDFKPGMQGGKEVPVWYMVPITFALSGDKAPEMILPPPPPPPPPAGATVVKETATDRKSTDPFVIVEEMPVFPGGDMALLKFISENTKYPESAKKQNIAGRVIVRFCVNAAGNVELISVMEGVDPALDAEAIRVCSMLPAFKPGKQGGKEVPVWIMVPITFSLK